MGFLSKIFKGFKKLVKKVAKGIKKVAKFIFKPIKAVLKPLAKVFGKLGPLGTIALGIMLPGIGGIMSSWFNAAGGAFQGLFAPGSFMHNAIGAIGRGINAAGRAVNWVHENTIGRVFGKVTDVIKGGINNLTGGKTGRFGQWVKDFTGRIKEGWNNFTEKLSYKGDVSLQDGEWFGGDVTKIDDIARTSTVEISAPKVTGEMTGPEIRADIKASADFTTQRQEVWSADELKFDAPEVKLDPDSLKLDPEILRPEINIPPPSLEVSGVGHKFGDQSDPGLFSDWSSDESLVNNLSNVAGRATDKLANINLGVGTTGDIYDAYGKYQKGEQLYYALSGGPDPIKPRMPGQASSGISGALLSGVDQDTMADPLYQIDTTQFSRNDSASFIQNNVLKQFGMPTSSGLPQLGLPMLGWGWNLDQHVAETWG